MQRLNSPMVMSLVSGRERTYLIDPTTSRASVIPLVRTAVGGAAHAVVAQVVCEQVVAGVVEDLVVGDEVDLEAVAAWRPVRMPGLEVGGNARAAEAHRVIGDDQLARAGGGDVPRIERHAVEGGEADVLELDFLLGRRVQDGRAPQEPEPVSEALQGPVGLLLG
jgi:hypothetical protein